VHQYRSGAQAVQADDILQDTALMFQGAPTQFDHQRPTSQVFDRRQHLRDQVATDTIPFCFCCL
jgi:hypothetical protein